MMPVPALKNLAKETGKSLDDLERYWDEAKAQVKPGDADDKWAMVMAIVKRRAGASKTKKTECSEVVKEEKSEEGKLSGFKKYTSKITICSKEPGDEDAKCTTIVKGGIDPKYKGEIGDGKDGEINKFANFDKKWQDFVSKKTKK